VLDSQDGIKIVSESNGEVVVLLPTHLAIGYLVGDTLADCALKRNLNPKIAGRIVITTMLFAVLADIDIVWWLIKKGSSGLGDSVGGHHAYITHVPFFYLLAALLAYSFMRYRSSGKWLVTAGLLGAMSHFVLDSFLIGWGIMWLYPFSSKLIGWNIVTYRYRSEWGDEWLRHYLVHPFALIEYGFILLALVRAKWNRHADGTGLAKYATKPDQSIH
jgi:membrane-bound metal-dependent hydrolase YbcI (DUF457 family)